MSKTAYFGNDKVTVIERGVVEVDKDIMIAECRYFGFVVKFEALKSVHTLNGPLLRRCRCHCERYGDV